MRILRKGGMPLFKRISLCVFFLLISKAMRGCTKCWVMSELTSLEIKFRFQVKKVFWYYNYAKMAKNYYSIFSSSLSVDERADWQQVFCWTGTLTRFNMKRTFCENPPVPLAIVLRTNLDQLSNFLIQILLFFPYFRKFHFHKTSV